MVSVRLFRSQLLGDGKEEILTPRASLLLLSCGGFRMTRALVGDVKPSP